MMRWRIKSRLGTNETSSGSKFKNSPTPPQQTDNSSRTPTPTTSEQSTSPSTIPPKYPPSTASFHSSRPRRILSFRRKSSLQPSSPLGLNHHSHTHPNPNESPNGNSNDNPHPNQNTDLNVTVNQSPPLEPLPSTEQPPSSARPSHISRGFPLKNIAASLSPSAGVPPLDDHTPTVAVAVPIRDLFGSVDNGLRKKSSGFMNRFLNRCVRVEASACGVKDFVFYAPEGDPSNRRATPTEFVKVRPTDDDKTIVRRNDNFEISFVGMSVIPEDTIFVDKNELLLYSLKTSPDALQDIIDDAEKLRENQSDDLHSELTDMDAPIAPTSGYSLSPDDIPFIHYDPVVDGHDVGTRPNAFIPVPASKALFYQHNAKRMTQEKPENGLSSVSLRFNVLEIDCVSDGQARAVGSIGELGKMVKTTGVPYLQPLSMAINAASAIGKEALKNYSKPDHVMSKDLMFLLAEPTDSDRSADRNFNSPGSSSSSPSSSSSGSDTNNRVENYGNFLRVSFFFLIQGRFIFFDRLY